MKIKLLILLIAPLLLMNCKEDDSVVDVYLGTWVGSTLEATGCNSDNDLFRNDLSCDDNSCYRLTLNGDGTFSFQQGLPTISGTWSLSASDLSLCVDEEDEIECVIYATTLGLRLTLAITSESTGCSTTTTLEREVI